MNILKILTAKRAIGNFGENEAVKFLRRRGYRILERGYIANNAEIDIIAKNKNVTAFIEVKTRNVKGLGQYETRPASAVTPEKQRKIIKAARYYNRRNPSDTRLRFDIIEVYIEDGNRKSKIKEIKHLEGAFDINSAFDKSYYYTLKKEGSNL